ncbi:MAG: hypothetical protein ACE37K_12150 [Planctomycetota bacterium]
MMSRCATVILSAACLLPAQQAGSHDRTQAPTKGLPEVQPHIVIETVGPDGWRARLGPTNLGVMLASEQGRELWQPSLRPLFGMWQSIAGSEEAYQLASERLLGYGGTIRVAAHVNERSAANVAIVFDGDRDTDLDAVAKDVRRLIEGLLPGEWQQREVRGGELTIRSDGPDFVSAPRVEGGRLMLLLGDRDKIDNAVGLGAWLAARPATLSTPKPGSPAARLTFDLPRLISLGDGGRERAILKALGLDGLRELTLTLSAAGPRVQFGADVRIEGAPRGVVKAFLPTSQGISGLVALLPQKVSAGKVGRFDLHALYQGIVDALEADIADEDVREEIEQELGLDPGPDMLAHLTDEMLVVGSPFQDFDRASEATWMLAWRVRDEPRFVAGFEKLMRGAKPVVQTSETVDVDGVKLRRYGNPFGYDLWMAAANGVWAISGGRDAEEAITALLKQAKGQPFAPLAAPATGFDGLARNLPAGVNGVATADLGSIVGMPVDFWLELLTEVVPFPLGPGGDGDQSEEQMEAMRALLKQHNLTQLRSATGFAADTWRWRLYW